MPFKAARFWFYLEINDLRYYMYLENLKIKHNILY